MKEDGCRRAGRDVGPQFFLEYVRPNLFLEHRLVEEPPIQDPESGKEMAK